MNITEKGIGEIQPYDNNPRKNDGAVKYVAESIRQFGWKVPIVIDKDGVIVAGHTRYLAAMELGIDTIPCIIADDLTDEQVKAFRLADNKVAEFADWDTDMLAEELGEILDIDMEPLGFELDMFDDEPVLEESTTLAERFVVPPFSVLDGRQGAWLERKREWRKRIGEWAQERDAVKTYNNSATNDKSRYKKNGVMPSEASILDPVLSEVIVKWFAPTGGKCFDNFAGDTVFGYVSATMGMQFTGIELRQEQCDFNSDRVQGLDATYICDDGRNVLDHIDRQSQDLYFSCPPYYDLEVYSDDERDVSNQETYEEFYQMLETAFVNAIECLKDNRFAVIVCGDVRDKKTGKYYCFPDDIKRTFTSHGMVLYNELVLLDPIGTAMIRAANYMKSRKVAKVHQNVLVFYKGDTRQIRNNYPIIEVDYESTDME